MLYCREAFQCCILLCTWHVRRAWIKKLQKLCCNDEVVREMFRHLGGILYCTRYGSSAVDAIEEFMQIFVDQCGFIDYFKSHFLSNIGIFKCWLILYVLMIQVFLPYTVEGIFSYPFITIFLISPLCDFQYTGASKGKSKFPNFSINQF